MLLEDVAALCGLVFAFLGVGLTIITGNSVFDAIGTLAIGALLVRRGGRSRHRDQVPAGRRGREPGGCRRHPRGDRLRR